MTEKKKKVTEEKTVVKKKLISFQSLLPYITQSKVPELIWFENKITILEGANFLSFGTPFFIKSPVLVQDKELLNILVTQSVDSGIAINYVHPHISVNTTSKANASKKFVVNAIDGSIPESPYKNIKVKKVDLKLLKYFKDLTYMIHPKLKGDKSFFCYISIFNEKNHFCVGNNTFILTKETPIKDLNDIALNNIPLKYILDSSYLEDLTFQFIQSDKGNQLLIIKDSFQNFEIMFKLHKNLNQANSKLAVVEQLTFNDKLSNFKVNTQNFSKAIQEIISEVTVKTDQKPLLDLSIKDSILNIDYISKKKINLKIPCISNFEGKFTISTFTDKFLENLSHFISEEEITFYINKYNNLDFLYFKENETIYLIRIQDFGTDKNKKDKTK